MVRNEKNIFTSQDERILEEQIKNLNQENVVEIETNLSKEKNKQSNENKLKL